MGAVLIAIKSFFSGLIKAGYIEGNPSAAISIPVTPKTEWKNLALFQVEALFEAVSGQATEIRGQAILCLIIYAGVRAEEISLLTPVRVKPIFEPLLRKNEGLSPRKNKGLSLFRTQVLLGLSAAGEVAVH